MNKLQAFRRKYQLPVIIFIGFLSLWHFIIRLGNLPPYLLPSPLDILKVFPDRAAELLSAFFITAQEALGGFILSGAVGIAISLLFAVAPTVRRSLLPYVVLLQTIPVVAISPLLILWLGNSMLTVLFIAFLICVPPIIANVTQGLISVEQNLLDLFRMSNTSTYTTLFKLRLPHALPNIFVGLRIASGAAVIGALVGETFAGSTSVGHGGLGYASIYALSQLQTPYLFAIVLISSLMGLLFFFAVSTAEWLFLRHWHESITSEQ
jgi:NitT/TauT family transport system permease protein